MAQIAAAAELQQLKPATYLRRIVLRQVNRDLRDAGKPGLAPSPDEPLSDSLQQIAEHLSQATEMMVHLARKQARVEKT